VNVEVSKLSSRKGEYHILCLDAVEVHTVHVNINMRMTRLANCGFSVSLNQRLKDQ
jgi:hypothetical protein